MKRNATVELILDTRKGDKVVMMPLGDVGASKVGAELWLLTAIML